MTIKRAIEILLDLDTTLPQSDPELRRQAVLLGIEALKWRQLMEQDYGSWCGPPLPGERKE